MPTYEGADGSRLHYDLLGAGDEPPMLVLAGGAARDPEYLGNLAGLDEHHRLAIPHLRGVGRSGGSPIGELGSWWRQAADVDRLRSALDLERVVLIGHSAGTRIAVAYAAQFPDRVARLVLITPPPGYLVDVAPDLPAPVEARMGDPVVEAAVRAQQAGPDPSSDDTFNAWQQAIAPLCYATWGDVEQAHSRRGTYALAAALAFFDTDPPDDLVARLGEVTAPTLVIAGAQDAIIGSAPVVAVADVFRDGRAVVIDECGHMPWVEQPAAFRAAIDPFVAVAHG